jgi:hypothetical protein
MRWRRLDVPGREDARVERTDGGWRLTGELDVQESGVAARLRYAIDCDAQWRTRSATIEGEVDADPFRLVLASDGAGRWTRDGVPVPEIEGALDVDLGFTPATNTLPIRRLALDVGESAPVLSAWLRFPELRLERLEQTYTRETELSFRYRALVDGEQFVARLDMDALGRVLVYEGLWEAVLAVPAIAADRAGHRAWLVSLTAVADGGTVVDLGCGSGEDLLLLAERHPTAAHLIGVDASETSLAAAANVAVADRRLTFRRAALDEGLPFDDGTVDVVYSHNLLECLRDPDAFAREVARVLRPGGQVVVAHWDWESQLFDGSDTARVRRLVTAYADWQQAWMANADGWMGRRLWGVFNGTQCFTGDIHARVLTNTEFRAPWFGHENAHLFRSLVKRGLCSPDDCELFLDEQRELDARGRYFYSITGYAYVGRRVAQKAAAGQ